MYSRVYTLYMYVLTSMPIGGDTFLSMVKKSMAFDWSFLTKISIQLRMGTSIKRQSEERKLGKGRKTWTRIRTRTITRTLYTIPLFRTHCRDDMFSDYIPTPVCLQVGGYDTSLEQDLFRRQPTSFCLEYTGMEWQTPRAKLLTSLSDVKDYVRTGKEKKRV